MLERAQSDPAPRLQQTHLAGEAQHDSSLLQVGLAVEVGSLQVAGPALVGGMEQQDVGWDGLVAPQTHKVPHADVFPASLNVSVFFPVTSKTGDG